MTMTSILSYPKFFLSGICRAGLLSRQRLSPTYAFLDFVSLPLYVFFSSSACVLIQSCTLPSHARRQAHSTHPSILSHMRHAQLDSWPRPSGERCGGGEGDAPSGPLVGGDEPGSSALSPDIHTQWVHSHTCLIAWPIGGGAH